MLDISEASHRCLDLETLKVNNAGCLAHVYSKEELPVVLSTMAECLPPNKILDLDNSTVLAGYK